MYGVKCDCNLCCSQYFIFFKSKNISKIHCNPQNLDLKGKLLTLIAIKAVITRYECPYYSNLK